MPVCIHGTAQLTSVLLWTDTVQTQAGYVDHGYGYTSPTYQDRYALCAGVCARELGAGLYARARVHGKHEHTVRVVTLKKKTHCSVVIFEKRADAVFYASLIAVQGAAPFEVYIFIDLL